jgi:hypothetical protein
MRKKDKGAEHRARAVRTGDGTPLARLRHA